MQWLTTLSRPVQAHQMPCAPRDCISRDASPALRSRAVFRFRALDGALRDNRWEHTLCSLASETQP